MQHRNTVKPLPLVNTIRFIIEIYFRRVHMFDIINVFFNFDFKIIA